MVIYLARMSAASTAAMLFSSKMESEMWTFALLSNSLIVMLRIPGLFLISRKCIVCSAPRKTRENIRAEIKTFP